MGTPARCREPFRPEPPRRVRPIRRASTSIAVLAVVALSPACSRSVAAQIPDTFTNLREFPEDIPRRELIEQMRGFSFALGVHCNFCHVGEDPLDLTGYDFASDEKETKRVARAMIAMRREINGPLLAATGRDDRRVVGCVTCHHGLRRPIELSDEILEVIRSDGIDAAEARYRELRERYYGEAAYDFGAGSLNSVAEALIAEREAAAALAMIRLNLEFYPEEPYPYGLQAQAFDLEGDREAAIASLEKAVALAPDSEFYRRQLERLRNPPA